MPRNSDFQKINSLLQAVTFQIITERRSKCVYRKGKILEARISKNKIKMPDAPCLVLNRNLTVHKETLLQSFVLLFTSVCIF